MNTCLCALLLAALALPAPGDEIVARVKVENPTAEPMPHVVIRGALPVPKDFQAPVSTLQLTDGERHLPTQAKVFSTYPGADARHPVGRPGTLSEHGLHRISRHQVDEQEDQGTDTEYHHQGGTDTGEDE